MLMVADCNKKEPLQSVYIRSRYSSMYLWQKLHCDYLAQGEVQTLPAYRKLEFSLLAVVDPRLSSR